MKSLIYELFSGVGFCNQLFSLETGIYLANLLKRKLILVIKHPLCHIGQASWDYGKLMDFFSQDYLEFLPDGIEIHYHNFKLEDYQLFKVSNKFSRIIMVDKELNTPENQEKIKLFANNREINILDLNEYQENNLYCNQSNASRCFYNFFTTETNYLLMSKICYSLTKLNDKFIKIFNSINLTEYQDYIGIHFRFGDVRWSTEEINRNFKTNILDKLKNHHQNQKVIIMSDRKDHQILFEINNKIYIEDLTENLDLEIFTEKNKNVIKFLIELNLLKNTNNFYGNDGSTVSNYLAYLFFINFKSFNYHNFNYQNKEINLFQWNKNQIYGAGLSWRIFWEDNIYFIKDKIYLKINPIKLINQNDKKIISYSLYNLNSERNQKRNFDLGILVNHFLAKSIYPDWILRIYLFQDETNEIINKIEKLDKIEIFRIYSNINQRCFRFFPMFDLSVKIFISRDSDSILSYREKEAVSEWLDSDKNLHLMHDHRYHTWKILCGMVGLKNTFSKKIINLINFCNQNFYKINKNDFDALTAEFLFLDETYLQHYRLGFQHPNYKKFPNYSENKITQISHFVGDIVDIKKIYLTIYNYDS